MTQTNLIQLAAHRRAILDEIVIDHPAKARAHEQFDFVVEHARHREGAGKLCVPLIGPSQSGKSTIVESYMKQKNTPDDVANRKIHVLHVTLEANVTRKGLAQNILESFEDHGFETGFNRGSETALLARVRKYLNYAEVKLLVLDEFHHLVNSENQRVADSVGETIKRLLIKGVCPIVLSGVGDAARRPLKNVQLQQRAMPTIDLRPYSLLDQNDVVEYSRFLMLYLRQFEEKGIVSNATAIVQGDVPSCIVEVTNGVLGATCNLLKEAVRIMTYNGRNHFERCDLADAADLNFVRTGLVVRNPFHLGLSPLRVN